MQAPLRDTGWHPVPTTSHRTDWTCCRARWGSIVSFIGLWVRNCLRRHLVATVGITLLTVFAVTVVAGSVQAARRSETSIERFRATSRVYDLVLGGCPPGVDTASMDGQSDIFENCSNTEVMRQLRAELSTDPEIEASTVAGFSVVGLLGIASPNRWGKGALLVVTRDPGYSDRYGRPIVVEGRLVDPAAPDEVVLSETLARDAGLHAGDVLHIASWTQANLDAAIDRSLVPETTPFTSTVVGVVRTLEDGQVGQVGSEGAFLNGIIQTGQGWAEAHGDDLASYGYGVAVRLRGGPASIDDFGRRVSRGYRGWTIFPSPIDDVDLVALHRSTDTERTAVLVFAGISAIAGAVFVGLTLLRQLRRELDPAPALFALGVTRRQLVGATVGRSLSIGLPAAALCIAAILAVSPLGPVGLARRFEFSLAIRADWAVLAATVAVILAGFASVGVLATMLAGRPTRTVRRTPRVAGLAQKAGAVPRVALSFIRGASPRAAVAVAAISISVTIAAGTVVSSFDRVIDEPVRYGGWWDVAVGQYSAPDALAGGVKLLRSNSSVVEAAGYYTTDAIVGGRRTPVAALDPYVGSPSTPMITGRSPARRGEIALGAATARRLQLGVGDTVELTLPEMKTTSRFRVVGLTIFNDPVNGQNSAGDGAIIAPEVLSGLGPYLPGSIAVRLDPAADRRAALDSLARDFPGSIRPVAPQPDLQNLDRLSSVPWLVALLVSILAAATLIHALVTMLSRRRRSLAVLATIGFTRRQRLSVGFSASSLLLAAATIIGLPLGVIFGRQVWHYLAGSIDIPSGPVVPWIVAVVAPLIGLLVALVVALLTGWRLARRSPADLLRAE